MSTPNQTPSEQDKEIAREAAKELYGITAYRVSLRFAENIILSAITKSKAGEQAKLERWTPQKVVEIIGYDWPLLPDEKQRICDAHNATLTGERVKDTEAACS